jgi:hypothetical protein
MNREPFKNADRLVPRSALYVSADLEVIHVSADELQSLAEDLTQVDPDKARAYRRLDLHWYQWLFHAMSRAQAAHEAGKIPSATWETMRGRFGLVWRWVRDRYEPEQIAAAQYAYPDARYGAPIVRDPNLYAALFREPALA